MIPTECDSDIFSCKLESRDTFRLVNINSGKVFDKKSLYSKGRLETFSIKRRTQTIALNNDIPVAPSRFTSIPVPIPISFLGASNTWYTTWFFSCLLERFPVDHIRSELARARLYQWM